MSRHDSETRLRDMLDHAREAVAMAAGKSRLDLDSDRKLNLSLVRLLEIIGEAAGRVSPDDQEKLPGIPWPDIVGLRNRLVHRYTEINFDILWGIVTKDLPPLIHSLEEILKTRTGA